MNIIRISKTQPVGEKLLRQKYLSVAGNVAGIVINSKDANTNESALS